MAQPINPPVPSTPPNSSNNPVNYPQSVCRESTRLRTPSLRPGFISTQGNSRHALVPRSPAISTNRSQVQAQKKKKNVVNIVEDDEESDSNTNFPPNSQSKSPTNLLAGTKQVASRTGIEVIINHAQDSDLENEKHTKTRKKKDPTKDKDGFDHARLFFYLPGSGPKQFRYFFLCFHYLLATKSAYLLAIKLLIIPRIPTTLPGPVDGAQMNSKPLEDLITTSSHTGMERTSRAHYNLLAPVAAKPSKREPTFLPLPLKK
ncbi:uncharacterized protein PGTG_13578 [Puccinia graminis f. sp. tritici CRL 75-36-700-3]|uniref:Uncharacterized protein n=1 Tax=Puccinia graminis f. sp. tritici (strain CRL 75-36-700-3 / race SCCL) TaxID=418459 RepID=E3KSW4_PUCGT|nr:uncharacterized protein PGTG_13578 [Puccinia graminis f. sp. tritici CRL 75-36-700-3]EFP87350.2 hypothetical protein PGTG_13578 [Puccinia graminis f. sp. tritici CRL 75-36-700-3]